MALYNSQVCDPIYQAASQWREKCLLGDVSLFGENEPLWSTEYLEELNQHFVQNLDAGEGSFFEKLEEQLEATSPEAKQLMAELYWLLLLFVSRTTPSKKREDISLVWSWSGKQLPQSDLFLTDKALGGIGFPGTAYSVGKWRELIFIIRVLLSFKAMAPEEARNLAHEPWKFAAWLGAIKDGDRRQFRHILLNLIFPEQFERICTKKDKLLILNKFDGTSLKDLDRQPAVEIDRSLLALRQRLESEEAGPIDFYTGSLATRWRPDKKVKLKPGFANEDEVPKIPEIDMFEVANQSEYSVEDIVADGSFLDETTLTGFLDRLEFKKNVILQGPPGTGKTWLAKRLAKALIGRRAPDQDQLRSVQFHPSLSYEDFVRGYRPSSNGLTLTDGVFLQVIESAKARPDVPHVLIIEEINRGNPAQVFGEMLTLLESTKRTSADAMELAYRKGPEERVYVPNNLYLIGTMNIADRSLALVDLALRRRFAFITLEPLLNAAWKSWCRNHGVDENSSALIKERLDSLNSRISEDRSLGTQFNIGHSYVTPPQSGIGKPASLWFQEIVETEIGPLLEEYWFDAPDQAKNAVAVLLADL